MNQQQDKLREECISNCHQTHKSCMEAVSHCLEKGGRHASKEHIVSMVDCATLCQTSTDFMSRQSPLHQEVCRVCAESCEKCAQHCDSFDDDFMKKTAEIIRRSAASCRQMAQLVTV